MRTFFGFLGAVIFAVSPAVAATYMGANGLVTALLLIGGTSYVVWTISRPSRS